MTLAAALPLQEHDSFWYELQRYSDWLPLEWLETEMTLWVQHPSSLRTLVDWGPFLKRYGGASLLAELVLLHLGD